MLRERAAPLLVRHRLSGDQRSFRASAPPPSVAALPEPTLF